VKGSFQIVQIKKKKEKGSFVFKHDLLSLTLLIIFGLHANNSAFSKFLHHKNVKVMWFACFVKLTISPFPQALFSHSSFYVTTVLCCLSGLWWFVSNVYFIFAL
jgi:hypothetical protein